MLELPMNGCLSLVLLVFAVAAFVVAMKAKREAERANRELQALRDSFEVFQRYWQQQVPRFAAAVVEPVPLQESSFESSSIPATTSAMPEATIAPPAEVIPEPVTGPSVTGEPSPEPIAAAAFEAAAAPPPPDNLSTPPPPPAPAPVPPKRAFDWESLVGVKLFSWIAGIALALAGVFFLKYSVEHGWLTPTLRVAIGLITGCSVIAICEMRIARNYRFTANAMDGAGVAILYATLFAAHSIWKLIPQPVVFAGMVAVTALAVFLAQRRDSVFIALLGLLGGFATPALLATGENRPIALFGYLLLLNLGLAWVAWQKGWPILTVASAFFTVVYQWSWVAKYLSDAQMPVAAAIFAVFAIAGGSALWIRQRDDGGGDPSRTAFERVGLAMAALPLFFALFAAAVPAYGARFHVLFAFLLLISAGLAVVAALRHHHWLHTIGGICVLLTFALWLAFSYVHASWPVLLAWIAAFVVVQLVASRWLPGSRSFAALLLFTFVALAGLEPATSNVQLFFVPFIVLFAAVVFLAGQRLDPSALAIAFVVATVTGLTWAGTRLEVAAVPSFLLVVVSLVLLFLAAVLRVRMRAGATPLFNTMILVLGAHLVLMYVAGAGQLAASPWPLFAALTLIDVAAGIAALLVQRAGLVSGAALLSQAVVMIWSSQHGDSHAATSIAFAMILSIAALSLTWFFIDLRRAAGASARIIPPSIAAFAGFVALIVAAQESALPPDFAAFLGTALLLTLAVLTIAFVSGSLFLAPLAALACALVSIFARDLQPRELMVLTGAFAALFTLFPLLLGAKIGRSRSPHAAAILGHLLFFFAANNALHELHATSAIGLLPLAQAAILGGLLLALWRRESAEERFIPRLALMAAAVLAFVTVAIPLQFENEWLTLGWVLEAAALLWLYRRLEYRGLLFWSAGLYAAVFIRLVFNSAVFRYHPKTETPVLNWYLYAYLVAAAAFFAGARMIPSHWRRSIAVLATGGTLLLFVLLNIEIADYFSTGPTLAFNFFSSSLAEDLAYTIAWGVFAVGVLIAGIALRNRGARIAALALLAVTILKCFLHDLGRLGGLYRVGSLLGLAIALVIVGLLIQRFVIPREDRDVAV